jgi:hypothetical protein
VLADVDSPVVKVRVHEYERALERPDLGDGKDIDHQKLLNSHVQ